jgi:hypothetical protein
MRVSLDQSESHDQMGNELLPKHEIAWELYRSGRVSREQIAVQLEVTIPTVYRWARENDWARKRRSELFQKVSEKIEDASSEIGECIGVSVDLIKQSLNHWRDKAKQDPDKFALKPRQIKDLAEAIGSLDKLMRLAMGEATEIREERKVYAPITPEELRDVIAGDQFIDLIPMRDYRRVKDGNTRNDGSSGEERRRGEQAEGADSHAVSAGPARQPDLGVMVLQSTADAMDARQGDVPGEEAVAPRDEGAPSDAVDLRAGEEARSSEDAREGSAGRDREAVRGERQPEDLCEGTEAGALDDPFIL